MKSKSIFFNQFFDELNKEAIDYCIMNGYEDYPEEIGSDIDIVVNSYIEFEKILEQLSKKLNFTIIQKMEHKHKVANFFVAKEYDGVSSILSLDIYEHYVVKERLLFDSKYFLEDKESLKNFYIPNSKKEFLYYFVKKIIKQDVEENIDQLIKLYQEDANFELYFKDNSKHIHEAFSNKDRNYFLTNKKLLRSDLFNSTQPLTHLKVFEALRVVKRVLNPIGFEISFLGPDGSGKSTIIEELKTRELPFRRVDYFHLKPRLFGAKGDGKPVVDPHAKEAYKGLLSYLKLFHFMIDYIIGFFVKVLPLKMRSSLVIFDRYYDDILVDPKRFRYGGNLGFAKFMRHFIPKPNLYFILTSNAEVIYERKQEVSFEELERQIEVYESLVDNKRYIKIDVNRDVKEIANEIENIIYGKLDERY